MYDLLTFFLKFKCNREKNLLQPGFPLQFSSSTLSFRFRLLFILLLLLFFKKTMFSVIDTSARRTSASI